MARQSRSSKLSAILILVLLLIASVSAYTEEGKDGLVVYNIEPVSQLAKPFAIVLPKAVFTPGESFSATVGSGVPCNTQKVILTIHSPTNQQIYYKDITSLFSPCSTSYVKLTMSAPSTNGDYKIAVTFKDATGKDLYTDTTIFRVSSTPTSCPQGYCTDWSTVQKYEFGTNQQKTCYTYDQANACKQTQSQFYRTVCDTGYELKSGACVKADGTPTCGDRVVQTGEACDAGDENGICPSTCNSFCQKSNCEQLPNEQAPEANPGTTSNDTTSKTPWFMAGGIILIIAGLVVYYMAKR